MPDIAPIGPSTGIHAGAYSRMPTESASAPPRPVSDRVDLSEHARHLERLRALPDVRAQKVDSIKASIERGTYDTPERMQAAMRRLLDELTA